MQKFYISGIAADIFTKFARLTYKDSLHIFYKFYQNSTCGSIDTTV